MKKRGFTLIELLAVIVVLAIIALIATPIVMNVIENVQKGAAERSYENVIKAAELYFYNKRLDGEVDNVNFQCWDGGCVNGSGDALEISGTVPQSGTISIDKEGIVTLTAIVINNYMCSETSGKVECEKTEHRSSIVDNGTTIITDSSGSDLVQYKIYGNEEGVGEATGDGKYKISLTLRGKNLMNLDGITDYSNYDNYNVSESFNDNGSVSVEGKDTNTTKGDYRNGFIYMSTTEPWEANTAYYLSMDLDIESGSCIIAPEGENDWFNAYLGKDTTQVIKLTKVNGTNRYTGTRESKDDVSKLEDVVYIRIDGCKMTISNVLLSKSSDTNYLSYITPIVKDIYLNAPLRCNGETCDYIDFVNQQVVRHVDASGNLLSTPVKESVELPKVTLMEGFNEILLNQETKLEIQYYN